MSAYEVFLAVINLNTGWRGIRGYRVCGATTQEAARNAKAQAHKLGLVVDSNIESFAVSADDGSDDVLITGMDNWV